MTTDKLVHRLDNWRFWVGVAYFGLVIVVVGLYVLYGKQNREQLKRVAIQQASAQTQVTNCVNAVKSAPIVFGFIRGQISIIDNQILSTTQSLAVASPGDPLIPIRRQSLTRLNTAKSNDLILFALIKKTTPTEAKCKAIAKAMNVPFPK